MKRVSSVKRGQHRSSLPLPVPVSSAKTHQFRQHFLRSRFRSPSHLQLLLPSSQSSQDPRPISPAVPVPVRRVLFHARPVSSSSTNQQPHALNPRRHILQPILGLPRNNRLENDGKLNRRDGLYREERFGRAKKSGEEVESCGSDGWRRGSEGEDGCDFEDAVEEVGREIEQRWREWDWDGGRWSRRR